MTLNSKLHPEVAAKLYAMEAGHLPASREDIQKLKDTFQPRSPGNCNDFHPEYRDYCAFARSHGYHCKC